MVTVEELYKYYEILSYAKDKIAEHEKEFLAVLEGVKGGSSEKRLASQLIARYYKHFPEHAERAINAQLDLCEDEDVAIRKQAIRDLPALCKDSPHNLTRIADVLTQLLQTDDSVESTLVHSSLLTLMKRDVKGTLLGVFPQIMGDDELVREKAIQFLAAKFKLVMEDLSKDAEEFFIEESKKVLQDVTGEEFVIFMDILSSLKSMTTLQGRSQLVDIIFEQAGLASNDQFDVLNADSVERLSQCTSRACDLFSKNVHSTKFVAYYCDRVLPALAAVMAGTTEEAPAGEAGRLNLVRQLADMSVHCPTLAELPSRVANIYEALVAYMPLPPSVDEKVVAAAGSEENGAEEGANGKEGSGGGSKSEGASDTKGSAPSSGEPKLQFSQVECLMFAFHQIARRFPEFLKDEENAARLADFRLRLQYFARGVQLYTKQLQADLRSKTAAALKTEENKVKVAALKTTSNIGAMIRDLFHNPPNYRASLTLSWKKPAAAPAPANPAKRPAEPAKPTGSGDAKRRSTEGPGKGDNSRQMYAPPTGRYSDKAGSYDNTGNQTGGYQRGGRGGRGRGRWRGRY